MDKFIVVLTKNRHLGMLAVPYLAEDLADSSSLTLNEKVNTENPVCHGYDFSAKELDLLKTLNKLSDRYLFRLFSKDDSIKAFYDNLDQNNFEKFIRPHIEKYMSVCFDKLAKCPQVPIYFKDSGYSNLYKSDVISIYEKDVEPVFYFDLTGDGLDYSLKLKLAKGDLALTHKKPIIITHSPCTLLIREKLYRIPGTDSKKFLPFFEKKHIKVAWRSVPKYMDTFVTNAIKNHHVVASGFTINEDDTRPTASLWLERDITHLTVLVLKFKYAQKEYLANSHSGVAVQLNHQNNKPGYDNYVFTKYQRDITWENSIVNLLTSLGLKQRSGAQFVPYEESETAETTVSIVSWLQENRNTLHKKGVPVIQKKLDSKYFIGDFSCHFESVKKSDWFDLQMRVKVGEFEIPFMKLRKCIINGINEYHLPNEQIFIIPQEWFTKYGDILTYAEEKDGKIRLSRMRYGLLDHPTDQKYTDIKSISSQSDIPVPASLNATLRSYQLQGYKWMHYLHENNFGGILADDMGLGKTLQTITLLLKIYERHGLKPNETRPPQQINLFEPSTIEGFNTSALPTSLIAMPTSLIHNWLSEFKKFAPSLKVYIYTGANRLKSKEIGRIIRHYHVVLTSYGIVRNDIEYLQHYKFHYFILDESQYIKNPGSKIYQAITQINCHKKIALTGTPIENALTDLWAQMNFVNKGLLGGLSFFKRQFVTPISKANSEEQEEKLQRLISPFILRRTKDKVATELPPISEQVVYCDMTKEQKKIYESEKSGIRNELLKTFENQSTDKSTFLALQGLTRLRQMANHPRLVDAEYKGESGKFNLIINNLKSIVQEKHKVLVFSSFVKDLELIEEVLLKQKINYSKLTGSTKNRQQVVDYFEKTNDCRIFLISLKAGGVGLNLISADYVFMLNPWWNPAAEAQAINRAHRIGQTKSVFVYRFISTGSIEEKIKKMQEHKSELADTFINSNNPFKNLDETEIKALFL
ncbi:Helicase conserved C-terminal domain-containing protein [Saccharicrinis carchari]|uniref:Helicase conserved C-terminal domain-containing protein n=1 Tax=Saccharicrinis carchari TaxID=1168039 RepID=A0A521AJF2_SACCC|nr:DEAD/DEAH box helicase [Saccharicrinis carchari]SMO34898.1 Helicase conserved C-terminal domain-containing protein [Saccharicrinis carchari]